VVSRFAGWLLADRGRGKIQEKIATTQLGSTEQKGVLRTQSGARAYVHLTIAKPRRRRNQSKQHRTPAYTYRSRWALFRPGHDKRAYILQPGRSSRRHRVSRRQEENCGCFGRPTQGSHVATTRALFPGSGQEICGGCSKRGKKIQRTNCAAGSFHATARTASAHPPQIHLRTRLVWVGEGGSGEAGASKLPGKETTTQPLPPRNWSQYTSTRPWTATISTGEATRE